MHISVRRLMHLARWTAPALAAAGALAAALAPAVADRSARFLAGAVLTALAFTALPRSRRSDLTTAVIAYSACLLLLDHLKEGAWRLDALVACAAGASLVFACSCLENLRSLARSDPGADLGRIYPARRRRPSNAAALPSIFLSQSHPAGDSGAEGQHMLGLRQASRGGSKAIGFAPTR